MSISDDHKYVAFGIDLRSNEEIVFMIKNTQTGTLLKEKLFDVSNVKFMADG